MKLNLIYYKNILDLAFEDFIHLNEDCFVKCNDKYVLSKNFTRQALKKMLEECVSCRLKSLVVPSSKTNDKYILIGSCYPRDNMILKFKTKAYFPKKLDDILSKMPTLKWVMKEHDIEVDISLVNDILVETFNEMFTNDKKTLKMLGDSYSNVIAVSHKNLDCYAMFKTIKWAYGSSNCTNIYKDKLIGHKPCLVALNDLVSKYIPNKVAMNRSYEFKKCAHEVKDYLDRKLGVSS